MIRALIIAIFLGAPAFAACVKGGCGSQLCVEEGEQVASTCEWTEEYGCYQQYGTCEKLLKSGKCGWRETKKLRECLQKAGKLRPLDGEKK
jgi:hypothetical protein